MIIPTQPSPGYIKKEDVKSYLEDRRKVIIFILVIFSIIAGSTEYMMHVLSLQPSLSPYITGVGVIFFLGVAVYLWFSKPHYEKVLSKLDKYKDQDMINTKEIKVEHDKWIWISFLFLIGSVLGWLIL